MESTIPLVHHKVKSRIRQQLGRRWGSGTKLPPIDKLATEFGVGRTTTYRAIRELVGEGILASRPHHGTFVCDLTVNSKSDMAASTPGGFFLPNSQQLDLTTKSVVIVSDGDSGFDPFQQLAVEAMVKSLQQAGVKVRRVSANAKDANSYDYPPDSAMVVVNPDVSKIVSAPQQLLLVLSTSPAVHVIKSTPFDLVSIDHQHGGYLAGEYLRAAGLESVCYLGCRDPDAKTRYDPTSHMRLEGFERGWGEAVSNKHRLLAKYYCLAFGARCVLPYLELDPRPKGIFAASDELAIGFVSGAFAVGLEPGRDYHIIGFDGQPMARKLRLGPLTTVEVPMAQMGEHAAGLLLHRFHHPDCPGRRLLFECALSEGSTVMPPPKDNRPDKQDSS